MTAEKLKGLVENLAVEEAKFEKGNNSAGARMRKILQEIKKVAQDSRVAILEKQKAAKAK